MRVAEAERVGLKRFRTGRTRDFYFSDQWQVLSEVVGGTVDKTYAWGLRYVDELLWRVDPASKRHYAMQDANFNCTAICDASGSVLERYQFDPYGNRVVLSPSWTIISASAYGWTVAHQGLMLEVDVGLYNCRNRVYSPMLGVWLQRDLLGYVDGTSLYLYVDSAPHQSTDPSGLYCLGIKCQPEPPYDIMDPGGTKDPRILLIPIDIARWWWRHRLWPLNSIICNSTSAPILVCSSGMACLVLQPGECTSELIDAGDFWFDGQNWYKCGLARCTPTDGSPGRKPYGPIGIPGRTGADCDAYCLSYHGSSCESYAICMLNCLGNGAPLPSSPDPGRAITGVFLGLP